MEKTERDALLEDIRRAIREEIEQHLPPRRWLTPEQAKKVMGYKSVSSIYRLMAKGTLEWGSFGEKGTRKITIESIEKAFIIKNRIDLGNNQD